MKLHVYQITIQEDGNKTVLLSPKTEGIIITGNLTIVTKDDKFEVGKDYDMNEF